MSTVVCDSCGDEYGIGDFPFCKGKGSHARYHRTFGQSFEVDLGKLGKHTISSLQDADRVQRYAAAHGQEISFRVYNQNPGNYRDNSMGENKQTPFSTRDRRGNSRVRRHRP